MTIDVWQLRLILSVAMRNLRLDRLRTAVIGTLLAFGAFLAVVGLSLLVDVRSSMRASITESIAGDLQLYSAAAKDDLALFGGSFMGRSDIGNLPDLVPYRTAVMRNANVAAFVPMGIDMAILGRGNELDDSLDALRTALKGNDPGIIAGRVAQLHFQMEQLGHELSARRELAADKAEIDQQERDLTAAKAPEFLAGIIDESKLQFLETKVAPLSGEKTPIYLQYLGTDIAIYQANFPKFRIVEGKALGPGERGIILGKKVREDQLKNSVARLFDKLHKQVTTRRQKIAGDEESERNAADLKRQYQQVLSYLNRDDAEELSHKFETIGIAGGPGDLVQRLTKQLSTFLTVDDANINQRYDWFYANIAGKIRLYEISPGQTITLRSYTKSGYVKTVPLKVFGVYTFDGLEDSDLAGAMNIADLVSFRELYGQMTEASQKELEQMRAQVGVKEVSAENAEKDLFGQAAPASTVSTGTASATNEPIQIKPFLPDSFDPQEVQHGLALNAAIKLKDPEREDATRKQLLTDLKAQGLNVNLIGWQQASGIVGQFVNIVGITLVFALAVIFLVAFVIINNSIIVGTLNRTREIGTMRAIGAQRSFVVLLFLAETGITGLLGALGGTVLAVVSLSIAGHSGIPAGNDVVTFLFSGPRLYPHQHWPLVVAAPLLITVMATLASVYAARHAARVQPADATQEKE